MADTELRVIHQLPLVFVKTPAPHEFDDEAECWCEPLLEQHGDVAWVRHR
jgi:hypothetical protein